jgi:hypothetical protein
MSVNLASYVVTRTSHPVWGKLPALLEAMRKYSDAEWIWWLDIDAIIMSPEINLYKHLLDPGIMQKKFLDDEPILLLDDQFHISPSGLFTAVCPPSDFLI